MPGNVVALKVKEMHKYRSIKYRLNILFSFSFLNGLKDSHHYSFIALKKNYKMEQKNKNKTQ